VRSKKREAYRGSEFAPRILADNGLPVIMKVLVFLLPSFFPSLSFTYIKLTRTDNLLVPSISHPLTAIKVGPPRPEFAVPPVRSAAGALLQSQHRAGVVVCNDDARGCARSRVARGDVGCW
jgi:hypothetical protein